MAVQVSSIISHLRHAMLPKDSFVARNDIFAGHCCQKRSFVVQEGRFPCLISYSLFQVSFQNGDLEQKMCVSLPCSRAPESVTVYKK